MVSNFLGSKMTWKIKQQLFFACFWERYTCSSYQGTTGSNLYTLRIWLHAYVCQHQYGMEENFGLQYNNYKTDFQVKRKETFCTVLVQFVLPKIVYCSAVYLWLVVVFSVIFTIQWFFSFWYKFIFHSIFHIKEYHGHMFFLFISLL